MPGLALAPPECTILQYGKLASPKLPMRGLSTPPQLQGGDDPDLARALAASLAEHEDAGGPSMQQLGGGSAAMHDVHDADLAAAIAASLADHAASQGGGPVANGGPVAGSGGSADLEAAGRTPAPPQPAEEPAAEAAGQAAASGQAAGASEAAAGGVAAAAGQAAAGEEGPPLPELGRWCWWRVPCHLLVHRPGSPLLCLCHLSLRTHPSVSFNSNFYLRRLAAGPEPEAGQPGVVEVGLRLPDGSRHTRSFSRESDTVGHLAALAAAQGVDMAIHQLALRFPRKVGVSGVVPRGGCVRRERDAKCPVKVSGALTGWFVWQQNACV